MNGYGKDPKGEALRRLARGVGPAANKPSAGGMEPLEGDDPDESPWSADQRRDEMLTLESPQTEDDRFMGISLNLNLDPEETFGGLRKRRPY